MKKWFYSLKSIIFWFIIRTKVINHHLKVKIRTLSDRNNIKKDCYAPNDENVIFFHSDAYSLFN